MLGERRRGVEDVDFDAGGTEPGDALAADEGVGVDGGDDAAGDAVGDECVGAGAGAAVVGAGLEGDVCGCAVHVMAESEGLLDGSDFGVIARVVVVSAFTDDGFAMREHTTNGGVG